jgi:hypothetical protein
MPCALYRNIKVHGSTNRMVVAPHDITTINVSPI